MYQNQTGHIEEQLEGLLFVQPTIGLTSVWK